MGIFSFLKSKSLSDVSNAYSYNYDEIKKRIRILVIDDNEEHFPIESLKNEGYAIDYWSKIRTEDISKLENGSFDIIVLDIKGVVEKSVAQGDGLEILERIKKTNPAQIVIAFSGHSFKLSYNEFWKLADGFIEKPTSFLDCKEKIEEIIHEKLNICFFWEAARKLLAEKGVTDSDLQIAEKKLAKSMMEKEKITLMDLFGNVAKIAEGSVFVVKAIDKIYALFLH